MIGKRSTLVWIAAFTLGLAIVAAVYGLVLTQPGDLQQRDLYPSLFLERVIEHSVYPLWSPRGTFNIAGTGRLPITLILVGFAKLFALDGATYARLIILWIVLAAYTSGFLGFSLLSRWRRGGGGNVPIGALVCGVVAAVNPWTIARLEHSWVMAQWAIVPIVVGAFAEGLRTGRKRWILGSALIMAAFGTAQPHYLVITTGVVFLTAVIVAVCGSGKPVRHFADLGLWALVLLPLSAHLIAPYTAARLLAGTGDPAYTLTDQTLTTISRFQDLPGTLLGTGNFNWQDVLAPSGPERLIWSMAAWVIALTPLGAILLAGWRRPATALAAGGYLVAVFLSMSHWEWTSELFQRAVNDVPGFWVFREPDRTAGLVVWSQALALGMVATSLTAWRGPRLQVLSRWAIMAYLAAAAVFHAGPATVNALWKSSESNYVPKPLPEDYRRVLRAVDRSTDPNGRILVASSDERAPNWDKTRIVRLMEAASIESPSITGDTRSPVPPSPVSGRWFEFFYSLPGDEAVDAARNAGFDRIVVVRDYDAGESTFLAISQAPACETSPPDRTSGRASFSRTGPLPSRPVFPSSSLTWHRLRTRMKWPCSPVIRRPGSIPELPSRPPRSPKPLSNSHLPSLGRPASDRSLTGLDSAAGAGAGYEAAPTPTNASPGKPNSVDWDWSHGAPTTTWASPSPRPVKREID